MMKIAEYAETQRYQWRERLLRFLAGRLAGTDGEKIAALDMVTSSLSEAKNEGIEDAASFLDEMAAQMSARDQEMLKIIGDGLREWVKRNREDAE